MRDILFRGKAVWNGLWMYGEFINDPDPRIVKHTPRPGNREGIVHLSVDPSTVGQYIGKEDKNGVQIFEGDIVHVHDATVCSIDYEFEGVVVYQDASFAIQSEDMTHYRWMDYEVEVIGNVHDGKEQNNG